MRDGMWCFMPNYTIRIPLETGYLYALYNSYLDIPFIVPYFVSITRSIPSGTSCGSFATLTRLISIPAISTYTNDNSPFSCQ